MKKIAVLSALFAVVCSVAFAGGIDYQLPTSSFKLGVPGYTDTGTLLQLTSTTAGYNQSIIQNLSNANNASSSYVVNNNLGTATTYFGEFGINSSTFAGSGAFNAANTTYLSSTTGDLALGTTTSNAIHFVVNGGTTDSMTISAAGSTTLTNATATAFTVGRQGATAPVFTVDASTGSVASGLSVKGAATGGTTAVAVTDSGSNASLTINAKGTGTIGIGSVSTGAVTITPATTITGAATLGSTIAFPAARKGTFVCTGAGTITISNSNVAAASNVIISLNVAGGTITTPPAMKVVTAGTSFQVLCGATDTSTYNYVILN
jgi:hypothetical protein